MNKENKKFGIKEIVAYEKMRMLPLTFAVSYILAPIYALVSLLLIGVFCLLMKIDDEKYLVYGLFCLGAFALISVLYLACVPLVRKKAIKAELEQYDFDASKVEELQTWDFSTEKYSLKFDRNGMYINDQLFYYNHLNKMVITSNYLKRIGIYLQFSLLEEFVVTLSVNPITLKMIECLEINLDNKYILEYIVSNKQAAFEQIYNKGYVVAR